MKKLSPEQRDWLISVFCDKSTAGIEFLQQFSNLSFTGEASFSIEAIARVLDECTEDENDRA